MTYCQKQQKLIFLYETLASESGTVGTQLPICRSVNGIEGKNKLKKLLCIILTYMVKLCKILIPALLTSDIRFFFVPDVSGVYADKCPFRNVIWTPDTPTSVIAKEIHQQKEFNICLYPFVSLLQVSLLNTQSIKF